MSKYVVKRGDGSEMFIYSPKFAKQKAHEALRAQAAIAMMQSFIAAVKGVGSVERLAEISVKLADALLAELSKGGASEEV